MSLLGGTVLLTGATGGLGQAMARRLASEGASLVLSGRRADVLEKLAGELGGRAVVADLGRRGDVQRLAAEARDVDVLVANAAVPASGTIDDYTVEQIDRALEVNLRTPILLARSASEGMLERGHGHLVFVSSMAGKTAIPRSALYSATKYGLRGFALGLRGDLHPHGIGVSTIFPGFIRDAGMWADAGVDLPLGVGTRSPDDVAAAVVGAVERNRAEVDVAPLAVRAGAMLSGLVPGAAAAVSRRLGDERIADDVANRQREKR